MRLKAAIFLISILSAGVVSAQGLFGPADEIYGGQLIDDVFEVGISGGQGGVNNWPGAEGPEHIIDGVGQKYLNFAEFNTGFMITPEVGSTVARSIQFWAANDAVPRDPTGYEIWGTNDTLDDISMPITSFTQIATGDINLPDSRNAGGDAALDPSNLYSAQWDNEVEYSSYMVIFPDVKDSASANSMQIAEVQLYSLASPPRPQIAVAGDVIGTDSIAGTTSDIVFGAPTETQGLAQFWYDGNMRNNVDLFYEAGDTGSEAHPLVTGGSFASNTTWWAGSQNANILTTTELPQYPAGLVGTRFEGSGNSDNYGVRLTGEIFFDADGEYLIRDGIDDFTMIAIDQDGNGELDDLDGLVNTDIGTLFPGDPIGDVLVLDDDWANLGGDSQEEQYHGIAEIENVPAEGAWRKIEIWMSEGGGGDAGIVYMANFDDPDVFDETIGDALSQEQRDKFAIPNDRLRSTTSSIESGKAAGALRTDVEYVVQFGNDGADQITINDNDGVFETTLDATNANIRIVADGDLAEGTSYTILNASNILGADSINLILDDPSKWDTSNIGNGILTFGAASCNPNTGGDLDGSGAVDFADFLILSSNFGGAAADHTGGDIDCSGMVDFADFLVLSANFGQSTAASAVPEPNGSLLALCGIALLAQFRSRRKSQ